MLAVVDAIRTAFGSASSVTPGPRRVASRLATVALDQGPLKLRSAASSALLLVSLRPSIDAAKLAAAIDALDSASPSLSYADAVHARALRANVRVVSRGDADRRCSSSPYKCRVHRPCSIPAFVLLSG